MMLNAYPRPSICQIPDTSRLPSAVLGAGAVWFGLPSAVRGIPGVGCFNHCAPSAVPVIRTNNVTIARFIGPPLSNAEPGSQAFRPASHTLPRLWFRFDYTGIAVQYVAFLIISAWAAGRRRTCETRKRHLAGTWVSVAGRGTGLRAPFVWGGVRRHQARYVDGRDHQRPVDEPTLLFL